MLVAMMHSRLSQMIMIPCSCMTHMYICFHSLFEFRTIWTMLMSIVRDMQATNMPIYLSCADTVVALISWSHKDGLALLKWFAVL